MSNIHSLDETHKTVGNPASFFGDFHRQSDDCFHNKQYYPRSIGTEDPNDQQGKEFEYDLWEKDYE